MSVHDDLMGFNIACDADDCAEANGSGVRAHEHFRASERHPELDPRLSGWILDFAYEGGVPRNDFCPACADSTETKD